jgi:all-trans-retinol 13,14-reductase
MKMEKFDVVIIGAGLGGLECGYILAKNGYSVCVLEKESQIGGCLQTFKRGKNTFDTGLHYVGGLGEGESLNRLFKYFDLMDLPWQKLDDNCFDEVILNGKPYQFAMGHERFVETLAQDFPHQRENLKHYSDILRTVGDNLFDTFRAKDPKEIYNSPLFTHSAYDFLNETIDDPTLRNVLAGTSLKMELNAEKLPLYFFAQINDSFIRSAWRINGGGSQIADSLANRIQKMGGHVCTNAKATKLIETDGKISSVVINDNEEITADYFISDIHPSTTLELIKESQKIRNLYRKRISNLPNTYGIFTANIALKEGCIPYLNRNQYIYETDDLWSYCQYQPSRKTDCALVSYTIPESGKYAKSLDILTPMHWEEVKQWENTQPMHRDDAYNAIKAQKAEECIDLASKYISGLKESIDKVYTSTPLTYANYTGTPKGSAYGICKDHNQFMFNMLVPRTPVPNLLLTGQNLNLHGILGVSVTAFFTCLEITGKYELTK